MMRKKVLNVKKGDTIFILDCSFIHEVGTKYNEGGKPMSSEQIHLTCDTKGKKAIVEKEPYEDTIIFFDEEETYVFIDVFIKDMNKHVSVIADYPTSQALTKEEFNEQIELARDIADIMNEYPYFE